MRTPLGGLLLGTCLAASSAPAQEAALGAALLERCTSAQTADTNWCVGFTYGVGRVIADGAIEATLRACTPPDLTAEAGRLLVLWYLNQVEELKGLPAHYAVWYAFRKEFPCNPN